MPTLDQVRTVLYDHCPDFLSGTCQCSAEIPVYQVWIAHVCKELGAGNGT